MALQTKVESEIRAATHSAASSTGSSGLLACGMSAVFYAWGLGARLLLKGQARHGVKQLLYPVGYWRFWVHAVLVREYRRTRPKTVLDVSSPKLPSLYFAHHGSQVVATDFQDQSIFNRWSQAAAVGGYEYTVRLEDARGLSFPDSSFDFLYSLSVIEHIPDNGDTEAMAEFARVVRDGGLVIVQVPFRRVEQDCYRRETSDGQPTADPVWYERYYSLKTLGRLAHHNLQVLETLYTFERLPVDRLLKGLPKKLRLLAGPLEWILALLNARVSQTLGGRPLGVMIVCKRISKAA